MVDIQSVRFTFHKGDGKLTVECPDCGSIPETLHIDADYLLECLKCQKTLIRYSTPEELSAKFAEVVKKSFQ
jgi:ribosomal protein S27E